MFDSPTKFMQLVTNTVFICWIYFSNYKHIMLFVYCQQGLLKIPCAMATYHMPHYDRELKFANIYYNLCIKTMKFNWQKKHFGAQYILKVYLYSTLATVPSQVYWISFSDVVCLGIWHICMWNMLKNLRYIALTPVNKLYPLGFFHMCLIWRYSDMSDSTSGKSRSASRLGQTTFGVTADPAHWTEFGRCLLKVVTGTLTVLFI